MNKIISALDFGTSKITILTGKIKKCNNLEILGYGNLNFKKIKKYYTENINNNTIKNIKKIINKTEKMSGYNIQSIYVSISDKNIKNINKTSKPLINKNLTKNDIKKSIIIKSINIKKKYKILHLIPQKYITNNKKYKNNLKKIKGKKIKIKSCLILYKRNIYTKLIKLLKKCNLKIKKLIFSGLASSLSTLSNNEKKNGVCLIDIGGGNIEIIIYKNKILKYTKVIPYGTNLVTYDISYAYNISKKNSEIIKLKYGKIYNKKNNIKKIKKIDKNYNNKYKLSLSKIIKYRYAELLKLIKKKINKKKKIKKIFNKCKIKLTGGGSKIKGLLKLAKKIFKKKRIKIGYPKINNKINFIKDLNYSTAIGMLYFNNKKNIIDNKNKLTIKNKSIINKLTTKIINWLKNEFF